MLKKLFTSLAISLIVLISGCINPGKAFHTNANGWKPADFDPAKVTLLIEKIDYPRGVQKKDEAYMQKNYPYSYEFADEKDLDEDNSKYADKNKYRFVMVIRSGTYRKYSYDASKPSSEIGTSDYAFKDRLNNKEYPPSGILAASNAKAFSMLIVKCLGK